MHPKRGQPLAVSQKVPSVLWEAVEAGFKIALRLANLAR